MYYRLPVMFSSNLLLTSGGVGSLVTTWNAGYIPSAHPHRLQSTRRRVPDGSSPNHYFGTCCATLAWHMEDIDLFSINYIHFGGNRSSGARFDWVEHYENTMKSTYHLLSSSSAYAVVITTKQSILRLLSSARFTVRSEPAAHIISARAVIIVFRILQCNM